MLNETFSIVLAILSALTAGLIGCFALMKKMTLAGDAISHVALPGLGLAIIFKINPIVGGAAALIVGAILIWKLEKRTGLSTETTIGVIFSASLAIGALITPSEELIEALFGGFTSIHLAEFMLYLIIASLVIGFLMKFGHQLVLGLFSPDLATSSGINLNRLNLYYLLAFSLTIVLGLRFLGALLVGSLIIIPAATSRQLTHQLKSFLLVSSLVSVASVMIGIWLSNKYGFSLGPIVVSVAAGFFVLSLFKKKK